MNFWSGFIYGPRKSRCVSFKDDVSLLRRLGNDAANRFVEFAERLNESERALFSGAMVKRFHPRAVDLLKERASREEILLFTCLPIGGGRKIGVQNKSERPIKPGFANY